MRPVRTEDVPFLRQMIYEGAFHEAAYPPDERPSFEEALADPRAARFVEGWGPKGDFGVVADRRGSNWGGNPLARLLEMALDESFDAVSPTVAKWHRQAIVLYERHGFVAVEEFDGTLLRRRAVSCTS